MNENQVRRITFIALAGTGVIEVVTHVVSLSPAALWVFYVLSTAVGMTWGISGVRWYLLARDRRRHQATAASAPDESRWVRQEIPGAGSLEVYNLDGILWGEAPTPPRKHECIAQTYGWINYEYVERCACGGIRGGKDHAWLWKNQTLDGQARRAKADAS